MTTNLNVRSKYIDEFEHEESNLEDVLISSFPEIAALGRALTVSTS
jgi:hypothetical protein